MPMLVKPTASPACTSTAADNIHDIPCRIMATRRILHTPCAHRATERVTCVSMEVTGSIELRFNLGLMEEHHG